MYIKIYLILIMTITSFLAKSSQNITKHQKKTLSGLFLFFNGWFLSGGNEVFFEVVLDN